MALPSATLLLSNAACGVKNPYDLSQEYPFCFLGIKQEVAKGGPAIHAAQLQQDDREK